MPATKIEYAVCRLPPGTDPYDGNPYGDDSFDFTAQPAKDESAIPVDLELVLLNDVSGSVADTKNYDFFVEDQNAEDGSSISFEVHCVRVITQNDAIEVQPQDDWVSLGG